MGLLSLHVIVQLIFNYLMGTKINLMQKNTLEHDVVPGVRWGGWGWGWGETVVPAITLVCLA